MNIRHHNNFDNELTAYLNLFAFERLNVFQFNNEEYQPRIADCAKLIDQYINSSLVMEKDLEDTIATLSKRIGIYYLLCENNRVLASKYLTNYRTIHDMKNKLAAEQENHLQTKTISKEYIDNEISYAETLTLIYYGLCNDAEIHENLLQQLYEHLNRYENLEKSILHAAKLAEIEISKALTYYCIALTAGKADAYEEAHQAIDFAIELQTKHATDNYLVLGDLAESQRLKAILFNNQQQLAEAEKTIKLAIATWADINNQCSLTHPQLFEARQTYAMILLSFKRYTEAVNLLNATLGEQKNFYHTEMHHTIVTTEILLGKILKEDNDLEHAYYEFKNALTIATQLALPTQMITEYIADILQQKEIPQTFARLSRFPHYAWNQYNTAAAFSDSVSAVKAAIDVLIAETNYLTPVQQEILNERCVELGNFYCYQHNDTSEALKYYRYVESKSKNFFTLNWLFHHIAYTHLQLIADFSVMASSEELMKAGTDNNLQCTQELGKSQRCLNALERSTKISRLEEILKLTFYSLYLQALQTYRWSIFISNNGGFSASKTEKRDSLVTAVGYLEQALVLYETESDLTNELTDDTYLKANNLYISISIELNFSEPSSIGDNFHQRLKRLKEIWAEPERRKNPDNALFNKYYGDYYLKYSEAGNNNASRCHLKALGKYKKSYTLLLENLGAEAALTKQMGKLINEITGKYSSFFQSSSSSNDSNPTLGNSNREMEECTPQQKI